MGEWEPRAEDYAQQDQTVWEVLHERWVGPGNSKGIFYVGLPTARPHPFDDAEAWRCVCCGQEVWVQSWWLKAHAQPNGWQPVVCCRGCYAQQRDELAGDRMWPPEGLLIGGKEVWFGE